MLGPACAAPHSTECAARGVCRPSSRGPEGRLSPGLHAQWNLASIQFIRLERALVAGRSSSMQTSTTDRQTGRL